MGSGDDLIYTTFTTRTTRNGGYIGGNMESPLIFPTGGAGFGFGIGHMNEINGWGGGGGSFASSAADAHRRFNGGILTPEIVLGFYQQQCPGQYYNISANYSPDGRGFNIASTSVPGQSMEVAITYASYEQVQRLMYEQANQGAVNINAWANGLNAFGIANGAKTEIIDYAVRSGSTLSGLRAELQVLGKTGTRYLNAAKGLSEGAGL